MDMVRIDKNDDNFVCWK